MSETLESKITPFRKPDYTWIGLLALVALLITSIFLITRADETKPADWNESRLTYLPSGKILKPMVLDLDEAVADLLWVQGMIYFADAYLGHKSYRWLGHILDIVTILNPRFTHAYEFGGVVLTKDKSEIPKTLRLLDRGIGEFPDNWRFRVYAAMAQLTLDSNFVAAAEYLKPIALNKDVPDHIRTLCATLLNKGGGRRVALAFLVDSYVKSNNTINHEIFLTKILKLYPGKPEEEAVRRETVSRVLHEIIGEPMITMMGLGVIHEYLTGDMSPQTRELVNMLFK
jgi:hypothetical protein